MVRGLPTEPEMKEAAHLVAITTTQDLAPEILPRPEHSLSRSRISTNALKVMYRLHKSGYLAYLVGGGVRDALLGLPVVDWDIATDAIAGIIITASLCAVLARMVGGLARRQPFVAWLWGPEAVERLTSPVPGSSA